MKRFFQRAWGFILKVFGGLKKVEAFLRDHIDDALDVANKIKALVESPTTVILLRLLPDRLQAQAEKALKTIEPILDKTLIALGIGEECLGKATLVDRVACFVEKIRAMSPAMRSAVYQKFAATYTKLASGTDQPDNVVDLLVQARYVDRKNQLEKQTA
jgi:hypothetical protein